MLIRPFDPEVDKNDVMSWWEKQGWDANTVNLISPNGFIAEVDNKKVVATWVLKTDTPIYLIEWTVGNPEVDWKTRNLCIEAVTDYACSWAKENGAFAAMIMTKNKRYINKLENNKFKIDDKDMIHLTRIL